MADKKPKQGKKEAKKSKKSKTSPKLKKLIEEIEKLSVLELSSLVEALEDKFGVKAMPLAPTTGPASGTSADEEAASADKEEKSKYTVVLAEAGPKKIEAIKAVREINQNLGLKEAKELVDSAPKEVLADVNKEEAESAQKKLEAAGAKVELK
jgi:large subunit ribosomal protein L7/L12